jgi:hypothetical protein
MTAEIVIMNREAVAIASDSAVTMTGADHQKVFTSANKIFRLSHYHPVGIMIYGNAGLMEVPWDTIIKIYRNNLGKTKYNKLKDYANDFINFLDKANPLFPLSIQDEHLNQNIHSYFGLIKEEILDRFKSIIKRNNFISNIEMKQIISDVIEIHYERWEKANSIPSISKDYPTEILKKYGKSINEKIKNVFKELPMSRYQYNQLKKIASNLFSKVPQDVQRSDISGVVITGFGDKDIFPSLESFHIEGIANNKLKYTPTVFIEIDFKRNAAIVPFAQHEMVKTFMEGLDPGCKQFQMSYISKLFEEYPKLIVEKISKYDVAEKNQLIEKLKKINVKVLEDFSKTFNDFIQNEYINPVTSVVAFLPKDELAAMAESLVNLTSFKRKVTMEVETVGGPVDVAIISKGDGFIWMKRKHYFKPELNPQFFTNYYKEVENGKQ